MIEGAIQCHNRFPLKGALVGREELWSARAARWHEDVEVCVERGDLQFVITWARFGRAEEEFEDVVLPGPAVFIAHISEEVGVFHLGVEVEVIVVPEQAGLGAGPGGTFGPVGEEALDDDRLGPRGFVGAPVELDGAGGPAALEVGRNDKGSGRLGGKEAGAGDGNCAPGDRQQQAE